MKGSGNQTKRGGKWTIDLVGGGRKNKVGQEDKFTGSWGGGGWPGT